MCEFNVTRCCRKEKHYIVDISSKVNQIVSMLEKKQYFTINRTRQYGKTENVIFEQQDFLVPLKENAELNEDYINKNFGCDYNVYYCDVGILRMRKLCSE